MAGGEEKALTDLESAATSIQRKEPVAISEMALPPSVVEGLVLLDRYELTSQIARGGMATVWRGRDRNLEREVAIKFTTRFEKSAIERFRQEALLTARLGNPNIVQIFDVGTHEEIPFLVMEFLEGETLTERLLSHGAMRATDAVTLFSQVAQALGQAHDQGIVHRDIKPSNIFLISGAPQLTAKVLDFGVAKNPEHAQTQAGDFVGTPHYMSVEQALDPRTVDARSDLFSLAIVVYEVMVGSRAYDGPTVSDILRKIALQEPPIPSEHASLPPEFDAWFKKAANRDPEERFQTADEFSRALQAALLEKKSIAYSRRTDPPGEPIPPTEAPATVSVIPAPTLSSTDSEPPRSTSDENPPSGPIGAEPGEDESVESSLQSVLPPKKTNSSLLIGAVILLAAIIAGLLIL